MSTPDKDILQAAEKLRSKGKNGDTILAHINPQEAAILALLGGVGTTNEATGLPQFYNSAESDPDAGVGGSTAGPSESTSSTSGSTEGPGQAPGLGSGGTIGAGPGQPGSYADTISDQVAADEGLGPGDMQGGTIAGPSLAETLGLSPSTIADMVNVGMNPDNPIDRGFARLGVSLGLPPDPAKANPETVMGMFAGAIPGARGLMSLSKAYSQHGPAGVMGAMAGGLATSMMSGAIPGFGLASKAMDMMGYETPGDMISAAVTEGLESVVGGPQQGVEQTVAEAFGGLDTRGSTSPTGDNARSGDRDTRYSPSYDRSTPVERIIAAASRPDLEFVDMGDFDPIGMISGMLDLKLIESDWEQAAKERTKKALNRS